MSPTGDLILLEHQDRKRWNREQIAEGVSLVQAALASQRFGPYTLQAAIAAVHAESATSADTDWRQIVGLYDVLLRVQSSAVVELNRAVNDPVEVMVNNCLIARGEVVVVEGNYGVRIQQIVSKMDRVRSMQ